MTLQFVKLVQFHGARALHLNFASSLSEILWMLVFLLVVSIDVMLVRVLAVPTAARRLELVHLHILLSMLHVSVGIVAVTCLAVGLRAGARGTAMLHARSCRLLR